MSLTVQLSRFEGPLALLLYLIRKEEMDIFDINIHEITAQYLEYIKVMKELDLENAGEFIAMAATLLQIKSRMLLPHYNDQGELVETEDPRKELVQRLLEYEKFQAAAKGLYERSLLGRDVFARGVRERFDQVQGDIVLEENALFSLISAYQSVLRSAKSKVHQVAGKIQSIASRILEIKDRLFVGVRVALSDLIDSVSERRRQVLVTFLSALELAKMGFVSLYQADVYQEIYLQAARTIETDVISRVEEYNSITSADQLVNEVKTLVDLTQPEIEDSVLEEDAFVLKDREDFELNNIEMASDEEILAAEQELHLQDEV